MVERDVADWGERVEQGLTCAARACDVTAGRVHFELAVLHFEASWDDQNAPRERDMLSTALSLAWHSSTRMPDRNAGIRRGARHP